MKFRPGYMHIFQVADLERKHVKEIKSSLTPILNWEDIPHMELIFSGVKTNEEKKYLKHPEELVLEYIYAGATGWEEFLFFLYPNKFHHLFKSVRKKCWKYLEKYTKMVRPRKRNTTSDCHLHDRAANGAKENSIEQKNIKWGIYISFDQLQKMKRVSRYI